MGSLSPRLLAFLKCCSFCKSTASFVMLQFMGAASLLNSRLALRCFWCFCFPASTISSFLLLGVAGVSGVSGAPLWQVLGALGCLLRAFWGHWGSLGASLGCLWVLGLLLRAFWGSLGSLGVSWGSLVAFWAALWASGCFLPFSWVSRWGSRGVAGPLLGVPGRSLAAFMVRFLESAVLCKPFMFLIKIVSFR